jgi:hypothetical protein
MISTTQWAKKSQKFDLHHGEVFVTRRLVCVMCLFGECMPGSLLELAFMKNEAFF